MADLEIPVVSLEDVYGGKLVAALDRQHPRDLFDVMQIFAHESITPGIRWKLHNLAQLKKGDAKKFAEQREALTARMSELAWKANDTVLPDKSRFHGGLSERP